MNKKRGMTPAQAAEIRAKRCGKAGTRLQVVRVQKGLSQSQLAAASGIPVQTIQKYEQVPNAINSTRLNTLCGLSEALGCKIADIIDGELAKRFNKVK